MVQEKSCSDLYVGLSLNQYPTARLVCCSLSSDIWIIFSFSKTDEFWMQLKGTTRRVTSCGWVQTAGGPRSPLWLARRGWPRGPSQFFPKGHLWMVRIITSIYEAVSTRAGNNWENVRNNKSSSHLHWNWICGKWKKAEAASAQTLIDQIKDSGERPETEMKWTHVLSLLIPVGNKFLPIHQGEYPHLLSVRALY